MMTFLVAAVLAFVTGIVFGRLNGMGFYLVLACELKVKKGYLNRQYLA